MNPSRSPRTRTWRNAGTRSRPDEQAQADELLLDASENIRNHVSVYPETHEDSWWTAHRRGLEIVCCQMVRTAMEQQVSRRAHRGHAEHRDHPAPSPTPTRGLRRTATCDGNNDYLTVLGLGWPAGLQHRHGIREVV